MAKPIEAAVKSIHCLDENDVIARKTVIIPAFICPLVPLAIKRAGLKVEVCDIAADNFNFNLEELKQLSLDKDILAIVPTHLGGLALDFSPLEKIAREREIFLIEDCAQSLGAEYQGKKVGTLGDFSFFSLCRGKGLTIYEGGVVVSKRAELNGTIDQKISALVKSDFFSETLKIFELFGYWIFYRPQLFWWVFGLPQMFWNLQGRKFKAMIEEFDEHFPLHRVSGLRQATGHFSFHRIEEEIIRQRKIAEYYFAALSGIKGIQVVRETTGSRATYPYLTLLFDDPLRRSRLLDTFSRLGLGVSLIYAQSITEYDYLKEVVPSKECPGAKSLAKRQITLSTSSFIRKQEMDRIVGILGDSS